MSTIAVRPSLSDLYNFIDKVDSYPISVGQLLSLTRRVRASKQVADFYRSFRDDHIFKNKEDLTSLSEQVDIMRHEEDEMPQEIERGPEDF